MSISLHQEPTQTHIEHLSENISDNELHGYEKLVPSYFAHPDLPKLTYDPNQFYAFVVFDTETTCTGKKCKPLSAVRLRVPIGFFGIRDLGYLKGGIRDFGEKGERDSGL